MIKFFRFLPSTFTQNGYNINENCQHKTCEKCGTLYGCNSKEFDELCCEFYAKARTYWEQPLPGADEETEDSGGTLRLNYVPNTCNNCSMNSLQNENKNSGLKTDNCCNNCRTKNFYNESDVENSEAEKTKVFVECHTVETSLNEEKENFNIKSGLLEEVLKMKNNFYIKRY